MKVIIFAANGYIGKVLVEYFNQKRADVVAITRKPTLFPVGVKNLLWDGKTVETDWAESLNAADVVINLAGKSVNCRYNEHNKREIFDSRTLATQAIEKAIASCQIAPKLWINTIYRHAEDRAMDEFSGEIGSGFSVEVCQKWEKTFLESVTPNTRKIALRMAIVLGKTDGVFVRLRNLVRFGLGGKQGDGKQMFSWIHDQDLCRIIDFAIENETLEGVYNASSPYPVSNQKIMKTIREALKIPFGLPSPKWLLEIGAILIGTETELIFKSRWVVPTKLLQSGFRFQYSTIEEAVNEIVNLD